MKPQNTIRSVGLTTFCVRPSELTVYLVVRLTRRSPLFLYDISDLLSCRSSCLNRGMIILRLVSCGGESLLGLFITRLPIRSVRRKKPLVFCTQKTQPWDHGVERRKLFLSLLFFPLVNYMVHSAFARVPVGSSSSIAKLQCPPKCFGSRFVNCYSRK